MAPRRRTAMITIALSAVIAGASTVGAVASPALSTSRSAAAAAQPHAALAGVPVSGQPFTVSSPALSATGLTFVSVGTVGGQQVMTFTADRLDFTTPDVSQPCFGVDGTALSWRVRTHGSGTLSLAGSVVLQAVSLAVTGSTWTPAAPPAVGPLAGPFTDVTLTAVSLSANSMTSGGRLKTETGSC